MRIGNSGKAPLSGEVLFEAVNAKRQVEKRSGQRIELIGEGKANLKVNAAWDNPKLWWPDDPVLYTLRATLTSERQDLNISETSFGFREWSWEGRDFKLNGIVWHGWADTHTHATKEEWLDFYRKTNQRFMRFWGTSWMNLPPEEALDFFDKSGVVVRRSGMLDGEAIGYMAIEEDADLKKESPIKMDLMRNWRDQVVAQVKGERNHPSVMIWSIENEWLYINCINLYGGLMDQFEAEVTNTSRAVSQVDPTRPNMTDGGGAGKANTLPVHGDHYTTGAFPMYPKLAYEVNATGGGRGRWKWDQKRPRFIGEELYTGHDPAFAYFGGDEVFIGKQQARRAVGSDRSHDNGRLSLVRLRRRGISGKARNCPGTVRGQCAARRLLPAVGLDLRLRAETFARTFGIFNDTHYDDPINLTGWFTKIAGRFREEAEAIE